jgi:uncharacterized protein with FMN-binding domain
MNATRRQAVSALLAATTVIGMPVANAAAALESTSATPKAKTTKTSSAKRTIVGDTAQMERWGPVTVTIVVQNGKVLSASADMPMEKPRSNYINSRVGPYLNAQVVQIQSSAIDLISGATQSCDAYQQSLQSALDKAGIKKA